jgi:hypothetical protein
MPHMLESAGSSLDRIDKMSVVLAGAERLSQGPEPGRVSRVHDRALLPRLFIGMSATGTHSAKIGRIFRRQRPGELG